MKKIILSAFIAVIAISLKAQSPFDDVYRKYANTEGATTVEISQKLFALCASAIQEQDPEIKELVQGLKGIKIISFENQENAVLAKSMYKEFEAALPAGLDELMHVNDDGEKVKMLGRVLKDNIVDELILLVDGDGEFVMIQISGMLDFTKIGKMADIDIDALDDLEKLNK